MKGIDGLKRFIGVGTPARRIVLESAVILALTMLPAVLLIKERTLKIVVLVVLAVFAVLRAVRRFGDLDRYAEALASLERRGLMEDVLKDFNAAAEHLQGRLLLGETYLFLRGCGRILTYGEIDRLYIDREIHSKYMLDRLKMRLTDSEIVPIVNLPAAFSVDPVPAITAILEKTAPSARTIGSPSGWAGARRHNPGDALFFSACR